MERDWEEVSHFRLQSTVTQSMRERTYNWFTYRPLFDYDGEYDRKITIGGGDVFAGHFMDDIDGI